MDAGRIYSQTEGQALIIVSPDAVTPHFLRIYPFLVATAVFRIRNKGLYSPGRFD